VRLLILKKGALLLILTVNAIPLLYYVFKHLMKRLILQVIYMYTARQNNDSTNPFNLYWTPHSLDFTLYRKQSQYYIQIVISAFREILIGLMPSLWQTNSCVPCQIIQCTLNSLFALYVASYFSAIFMNLFPYLIARIITCYLP
jgi:hypothetical protein